MKKYAFLVAAFIVASLIAAAGYVWAQTIPGQTRLVCTMGGEIVFDEHVDSINRVTGGLEITLNGHTETLWVPDGMQCH